MSACDASQEAWYEAQLQLKQEAGELPKVPFLCVADPPGPRVGSGGSTLHILALLEAKYPGKLDHWKVLVIHDLMQPHFNHWKNLILYHPS